MKGLVMKDLYIIRDYWLLLAMALIAAGVGMSIIVSPWVVTPIFATILGSVAVSTIQTDRTCNWHQLAATMPVRRGAFVSAKFALYALALAAGLAIGMLTGGTVRSIQGAFDLDEAVAAVEQGTIPNCIFPEELGMVKKFVGQTGGGC